MPPLHRTDHIGSLLRPHSLLQARESLSSPTELYTTSPPTIKQAEKAAIHSIVQDQLTHQILPITSGEFCRHIYYSGLFESLSGMTPYPSLPIPSAFRTNFPTTTGLAQMGFTTRAAVICTGPIRWTQSAYLEEWNSLIESLPENQWKACKITMPAPSYQHIQLAPGTAWTKDSSGYSSDIEYFTDLARAYTAEISTLYKSGCRNIQIDDPHLTYFCSEEFLSGCKVDGVDATALLDLYLTSHNLFLRERPQGLHMGIHLCRGNMSGSKHWVPQGGYERIAEKLFQETGYETYYLEFDDLERTGGFEVLRFLPRGKNVVLGLVSTKRVEMEDRGELKARIYQAAEWIAEGQEVSREEALGCLAVSPQCGFSSSSLAGGKGMTEERMWEKLELVRDVAREVWRDAA